MYVYRFELKFSYIEPNLDPARTVGPFARYSTRYSTKNGFDRLLMTTPSQFQPEPTEDGIYSGIWLSKFERFVQILHYGLR
ncbi:hypothetical protein [Salmonella phage SD-1_S14]|nr:hypothetical protein [Salmonella phage SD-1_S14]